MNDKDLKQLVVQVNDMHGRVRVIETKCTSIEGHLRVQNDRLNKHAERLRDVEIKQEGLGVSQKYIMLAVGFVGAVVGGIVTAVINIIVNGGLVI